MDMLMFAVLSATEWDIGLSIALFIIGGLMAIVAYLFSRRMEAYDEHLKECTKRAVAMGRMEERLESVEGDMTYMRAVGHWLGDCMILLGSKIGLDNLPPRPEYKGRSR